MFQCAVLSRVLHLATVHVHVMCNEGHLELIGPTPNFFISPPVPLAVSGTFRHYQAAVTMQKSPEPFTCTVFWLGASLDLPRCLTKIKTIADAFHQAPTNV